MRRTRYRDVIRPDPRRELEDELRFHLESSIPLFNRRIDQLEKSKANRPGTLGDRPLVVIGNMTLAHSEDYLSAQSRLLALSRQSSAMISATTAHQAPLDDPGTIVRAAEQVVDEIRKR